MPKDGRLYVPVDVNFADEYEHLSSDAFRLFIELLSFAKRIANRGYFTRSHVRRATSIEDPSSALRELFDAGLIEAEIEAEGVCFEVFIPSFRAWNDPDRAKQEAGRKGGVASGYVRRQRSKTKQVLEPELKQVVEQVEKSREEKSKEIARRRRSAPPSELVISPEMRAWARERGLTKLDLERETSKMLDHHRAKGSMMLDWVAAWRTWMTRAGEYQPGLVTVNGKSQPADGARIPPPVQSCGECDSGWTIDNEGRAVRCRCQRAS